MVTTYKLGRPARVARWGLDVDRRDTPRDLVVLRFPMTDPGDEGCEVVARYAWSGATEALAARIATDTGMSAGTAVQLITQLAAKLSSPRSADTERGLRPTY